MNYLICLVMCALVVVAEICDAASTALLEECVVFIDCKLNPKLGGTGTGFIVSSDGLIITADHIITDPATGNKSSSITAIRYGDKGEVINRYDLNFIRSLKTGNVSRDIALLKITNVLPEPLPFLKIGEQVPSGTEILVAGFPNAFDQHYSGPFIRRGIVSNTRLVDHARVPVLILDIQSVIGDSGAPIVDIASGHVIGVLDRNPSRDGKFNFSRAYPLHQEDVSIAPLPHEVGTKQ